MIVPLKEITVSRVTEHKDPMEEKWKRNTSNTLKRNRVKAKVIEPTADAGNNQIDDLLLLVKLK